MIITNIEYLPNKEIVEHFGVVSGSTVRAKHAGRDFAAGLKNMFGGELKGYTELLGESRDEAIERMKEDATSASEIINIRIETSSISKNAKDIGSVEVLAYGTAIYR